MREGSGVGGYLHDVRVLPQTLAAGRVIRDVSLETTSGRFDPGFSPPARAEDETTERLSAPV